MADSAVRKRKKDTKGEQMPDTKPAAKGYNEHDTPHQDDEEEEEGPLTSPIIHKIIRYSFLLVFFGSVIFARQNPETIKSLIDEWIGFSDHWDTTAPTPVDASIKIEADLMKRSAIVSAFRHAWAAYERDAMGADEYHPVSMQGSNLTEAGGIGYMVVDALDTMQIMGLHDEYSRARHWVETKLDFDRDGIYNVFETTIRVLGGLLSAYHFSNKDQIYLQKAQDLANRLLPAFETASGLPRTYINLHTHEAIENPDFPGLVCTSEIATLQLELRYLSYLTDDDTYWKRGEKVMQVIKNARLPHGMASIFMDEQNGNFVTSAIRLGSRADSFYEYLLKQYIQTNRQETVFRDMYDDAVDALHQHLIQTSTGSGHYVYTAELVPESFPSGEIQWRLTPKQDHLVCYFGGSLLLGAVKTGALVDKVSIPPQPDQLSEKGWRDWKTGISLVKTCMGTHETMTGLPPEVVHFRIESDGMSSLPDAPEDWYIRGAQAGEPASYDARYMLRPETIESLFIAYRLTGDNIYREYGWKIFRSLETYCRLNTGGYATIVNVDEIPVTHEDKMETFMLSETLKYLYLLFSDGNVVPLDEYVFNTEAHPLPIFEPTIRTGFS